MANIKVNDINTSESGLLSELTEAELLGVKGSGLWTLVKKVGRAVGEFIVDVLD